MIICPTHAEDATPIARLLQGNWDASWTHLSDVVDALYEEQVSPLYEAFQLAAPAGF